MNINELTLGQLKEIAGMVGCGATGKGKRFLFEIGKVYYISTVTRHYIGRVVDVLDDCVVLTSCSWVGNTGRFHKFLQGELTSSAEIEPWPAEERVSVFRGPMLDASEWPGEPPTVAK